jgi:hypothetical protein
MTEIKKKVIYNMREQRFLYLFENRDFTPVG